MDKEQLRKFFSEFWQIDVSVVHDDMKIDDTALKDHNSIRFYQFIAAIESNFNVKVDDISNITNFSELFDRVK